MMKFKFQSFMDVSTSATSMQVIQFSVGGADVVNRCMHLFGAYKYFKLGKISIKMVPASTLPVDPLGLSYASDDPQTVDPRDQMNPGLVRITNGEDIFTNVSSLTAVQQEKVYQSMMLDPRWSKFMLQSGFRRSAYPLYWQIGQLSQDKYPGATENVPYFNDTASSTALHANNHVVIERDVYQSGAKVSTEIGSSSRGLFQTGHKGRLGYLPTDYYQTLANAAGTTTNLGGVNNVPEVSVVTCVLPKAYKTVYYYRIFITEEVYFAGLRSAPYGVDPTNAGIPSLMYTGIDQFIIGKPQVTTPGSWVNGVTSNQLDNNGGKLP